MILVAYEGLPEIYYPCEMVGHDSSGCPQWQHTQSEPYNPISDEGEGTIRKRSTSGAADGKQNGVNTNDYGPWNQVQRKASRNSMKRQEQMGSNKEANQMDGSSQVITDREQVVEEQLHLMEGVEDPRRLVGAGGITTLPSTKPPDLVGGSGMLEDMNQKGHDEEIETQTQGDGNKEAHARVTAYT
ncbi:hypothetical protein K2173_010790 [Erythroxylum novogranatense]|uniref:Zinc knuckle CX2CX4HX4C domain-containing protein n=1 Tax=Erythroxylum novogranatense TaxID=1862640 RepID=A0AAV8SRR3_9ROSI|nr:hypothetical protein K2173_010790 [Erythroxylum novogranatense]